MTEMPSFIILLSFLFLVSEIMLVFLKRSRKKNVKKKNDRGSMLILWIFITISLTAGFFLAKYETWHSANYILAFLGIILFISGSVMRWLSIIQLKKSFTVNVSINRDHKLKTDGLYRIVRHPSYCGLLLMMTGLSFGMNNLFSIILVIIPVSAALHYRISVEENILLEEFDNEYRDYMKKTKKLIPFIY
jgi:protein-S-isoprenylcysteine O-methyltransferase Ste14